MGNFCKQIRRKWTSKMGVFFTLDLYMQENFTLSLWELGQPQNNLTFYMAIFVSRTSYQGKAVYGITMQEIVLFMPIPCLKECHHIATDKIQTYSMHSDFTYETCWEKFCHPSLKCIAMNWRRQKCNACIWHNCKEFCQCHVS